MRLSLANVSLAASLGLMLYSNPIAATNSQAELEGVMSDLLQWLPGDYSTQSQLDMERRLGGSADGEHEAWFRVFAPVQAPHIGEHIIYGQLHAGGRDGPIIPGTQVLYIVTMDEKNNAVTINGRRIADGPDFIDVHMHPERQKDLKLDPNTGGNCDFRWRRHGEQIVGLLANKDETVTDGTCTMVSKVSGLEMTWDAEWVLNDKELWIYDNGYLEDGTLFIGRQDRTHTRLRRVTWYSCEWQQGNASGRVDLHDGGGQANLNGNLRLHVLNSQWQTAAGLSAAGTKISVLDGDKVVHEYLHARKAGEIATSWTDFQVSCALGG
jgi:hypothetical protein